MITDSELEGLLANTVDLFSNVYTFKCMGHGAPGLSHLGGAIAHQHVLERRADFIRELRSTMCNWVYSKSKYREIFDAELKARNFDVQNAVSHIQSLVGEKFRKGFPQGQFGELLLFNFIQHFFCAPAVLRKMPITTNASIERHGFDAIHFRPKGGENVIFLGEAKSYLSKHKFGAAFEDAVDSILGTFSKFHEELSYYVNDNFIEQPLQEVAAQIKRNTLPNVKFELVCVVSYCETGKKEGKTQPEIEKKIEGIVGKRFKSRAEGLKNRNASVINNIHFIVLPFWKFEEILGAFDK